MRNACSVSNAEQDIANPVHPCSGDHVELLHPAQARSGRLLNVLRHDGNARQ